MNDGEIVAYEKNPYATHRAYGGVNIGNGIVEAFNTTNLAINNHAERIDKLDTAMASLVALVNWIAQAHPEVIREYKAVKDIQGASND